MKRRESETIQTSKTVIKQPIGVTTMQASLTNLQLQIIVEGIDILQPKLNNYLTGKLMNQSDCDVLSPFDDIRDNEIVSLHIPLQNLGIGSNRYPELKVALEKLQRICIGYRQIIDGKESWIKAVVFPTVGCYGIQNGKSGGYILLGILGVAAKSLFNMSRYGIYLKEVVRNCDSVYTARLYMYTSLFRNLGKKSFPYSDLREMLGMKMYTKNEKGESVEEGKERYPDFRKFRKNVLDVAQEELKKLYEEGKSDTYFTYQEVYGKGKKRGTPDNILFLIHSNSTERHSADELKSNPLENFLIEEMGLIPSEAQKIGNMTQKSDELDLMKFLNDIRQKINTGKIRKPRNMAAYVNICARSWLAKPRVNNDQSGLAVQSCIAESREDKLQEIETKLFTSLTSAMFAAMDRDYFRLFIQVTGEFMPGESLTLCFPSEAVLEEFRNSRYMENLYRAVQERYGTIRLQFITKE